MARPFVLCCITGEIVKAKMIGNRFPVALGITCVQLHKKLKTSKLLPISNIQIICIDFTCLCHYNSF